MKYDSVTMAFGEGFDAGFESAVWRAVFLCGSGGPGAAKHPLRLIREVVNASLVSFDGEFSALKYRLGRSSITPEKLLRVSHLQAFYSVRSERHLMEQFEYQPALPLVRGLGVDDAL